MQIFFGDKTMRRMSHYVSYPYAYKYCPASGTFEDGLSTGFVQS